MSLPTCCVSFREPHRYGKLGPLSCRGIPNAGEYTVWVRALAGGAHQDRALAVEVAGQRLKPSHTAQGSGEKTVAGLIAAREEFAAVVSELRQRIRG